MSRFIIISLIVIVVAVAAIASFAGAPHHWNPSAYPHHWKAPETQQAAKQYPHHW